MRSLFYHLLLINRTLLVLCGTIRPGGIFYSKVCAFAECAIAPLQKCFGCCGLKTGEHED